MSRLIAITTEAAEVALTAATAKTVLQVSTASGTNFPSAELVSLEVNFDSTSTIAEPVVIKLMKQTTAGTGTTQTPVLVRGQGTILCTAAKNFSAEPTYGDVIWCGECHPQSGRSFIFPLGLEPEILSNTRMGLVCIAPANVNCHATLWVREG